MSGYLDPDRGIGRRGGLPRGLGRRALIAWFAVCGGLLGLGLAGALHAEDYPYGDVCRVLPEASVNGFYHPVHGTKADCPDVSPGPLGPVRGE